MRNYKIYHNYHGDFHIKFVKSNLYGVFNKKSHTKHARQKNFYYICSQ